MQSSHRATLESSRDPTRKWLVEKHQLGFHRKRSRNRHPLLLPSGQLAGIFFRLFGNANCPFSGCLDENQVPLSHEEAPSMAGGIYTNTWERWRSSGKKRSGRGLARRLCLHHLKWRGLQIQPNGHGAGSALHSKTSRTAQPKLAMGRNLVQYMILVTTSLK